MLVYHTASASCSATYYWAMGCSRSTCHSMHALSLSLGRPPSNSMCARSSTVMQLWQSRGDCIHLAAQNFLHYFTTTVFLRHASLDCASTRVLYLKCGSRMKHDTSQRVPEQDSTLKTVQLCFNNHCLVKTFFQ